MADTKISAEAVAVALGGTEVTVGVQSAANVKISMAQIKTFTSASPIITGHATVESVTATGATGTGKFVFDGTPTLVTPVLGVATGTSLALGGATLGTNALAVTGHLLVEGVASTGATGTGKLVFDGTPTLVTPVLGTPTSGTLTNCTIPVGGVTGMGTNVGTFLVTPSGANLAAALTSSLPATDGGTGQSTFAKGDILASPGSNTLDKLTVGADGTVLTADAASTDGIKWATPAAGGGVTINSTSITGGTSTKLLFDNAGTVGELGPGTTTTLLHGNAAGNPSFGAVNLNADCTGFLPIPVNSQTGTTYTMQTTDIAGLTTFSNGSAVAVAIPQATGSFVAANFLVENKGVGTVTFTPTTSTIDGSATLALTTGQGVLIVSDGTNYTTMRGMSTATASGNVTVAVSSVIGGATTRILYDNAGTLGEYTISGTGTVVAMQTSPALVTPALGVATGTSLAIGGATLGANALAVTGHVLVEGVASTGATGTGKFVFDTAPTVGALTATSLNGNTFTTGTYTLTGTAAKTLNFTNTITLSGTDSTTMTFPPASASIGYLGCPINAQNAGYTLVLADAGKAILMSTAGTFTIPANGSVAFPVGTVVTFVNGTTSSTIPITSDTMTLAGTATTGTRTLAANGIATAIKTTSTTWIINGTGLT